MAANIINSRTLVSGVALKSKPDVSARVCVCVCVHVWFNVSVTQNLITSVLGIACTFVHKLSHSFNPLNAATIYIYGHIKLPVVAATIYMLTTSLLSAQS